MVESMQQSSATPKNRDVGRGLRKIVACSRVSTIPCSGFLYLQLFGTVSSLHDFYTCFTHFSLTMSISTNRGLPSLPGYRSRVPYIYAPALDLAAKRRMRKIELVIRKWRRILRKLPDLAKSPSERYKLSVCIKGSCAICIQAPLYNFYAL